MEIKKKIVVPTGEIYTAIGEKGMLEFLTVGDYGMPGKAAAPLEQTSLSGNPCRKGYPQPWGPCCFWR